MSVNHAARYMYPKKEIPKASPQDIVRKIIETKPSTADVRESMREYLGLIATDELELFFNRLD
jgi:hypothetical protein